jgi:hypothetical protein
VRIIAERATPQDAALLLELDLGAILDVEDCELVDWLGRTSESEPARSASRHLHDDMGCHDSLVVPVAGVASLEQARALAARRWRSGWIAPDVLQALRDAGEAGVRAAIDAIASSHRHAPHALRSLAASRPELLARDAERLLRSGDVETIGSGFRLAELLRPQGIDAATTERVLAALAEALGVELPPGEARCGTGSDRSPLADFDRVTSRMLTLAPGHEAWFLALSRDPRPHRRAAAFRVLDGIPGEAVRARLTEALGDPDATVREVAATVLSRLGPCREAAALRPLLRDPDPLPREAVAREISACGDREALLTLVESRLEASDPRARSAIAVLTTRSWPGPEVDFATLTVDWAPFRDDWTRWWRAHGATLDPAHEHRALLHEIAELARLDPSASWPEARVLSEDVLANTCDATCLEDIEVAEPLLRHRGILGRSLAGRIRARLGADELEDSARDDSLDSSLRGRALRELESVDVLRTRAVQLDLLTSAGVAGVAVAMHVAPRLRLDEGLVRERVHALASSPATACEVLQLYRAGIDVCRVLDVIAARCANDEVLAEVERWRSECARRAQ